MPSTYRSQFTSKHVVLPVIHVENARLTLRNMALARQAGCDGVFLINHGISDEELLDLFKNVHQEYADWWVGLNCLGYTFKQTQLFPLLPKAVAGLWVDNAMIDHEAAVQKAAEAILKARRASGWSGLYFGGVAFKYQNVVPQDKLATVSRLATQYMDVVTTSGPGTGSAAEVDKIRVMKDAIGDSPLAIASGITPENVGDYLPYADCFLVATGISKSFSQLDADKVSQLMEVVRG
ncbi:MAG: BtpA/SgcQ family protein [Verrucomicrobiota bacterium]